MIDEDEIEEVEFQSLLADKRHKELKHSLNGIVSALNKSNDDVIVSAIEKQSSVISGFIDAIKSLPAPKVNVQTSQPQVNVDLSSLKQAADSILEGQKQIIDELKILNQPKEFKIEFKRNNDLIQSPILFKQVKQLK